MNPATWRGHLETILPKPNKIKNEQHHKALPYAELPAFMAKLREMDGIAALALEFLILNANRTSEVIDGERSEIKNNDLWVIPKNRMKAHREHRVPLGKRSLEILAISKSFDSESEYLFSTNGKPLSNMAMSMLLRRMGYLASQDLLTRWLNERIESCPVTEGSLATDLLISYQDFCKSEDELTEFTKATDLSRRLKSLGYEFKKTRDGNRYGMKIATLKDDTGAKDYANLSEEEIEEMLADDFYEDQKIERADGCDDVVM